MLDQFLHLFLQFNLRILLVIMLFGLIIGKLRAWATGNFSKKPFGDFVINFFNLIGIPVHELGHLLFGVLFGFQIKEVCLYRTRKAASKNGGTLGFVRMNHKTSSFFSRLQGNIGNFFVGIGPLLFGPFVILLVEHFLPERVSQIHAITTTFAQKLLFSHQFSASGFLNYFHDLSHKELALFFLFLYVILGISSNLELSRSDLHSAFQGLLFVELLLALICYLSLHFGFPLASYIQTIYAVDLQIFSVGILGSILFFLISLL